MNGGRENSKGKERRRVGEVVLQWVDDRRCKVVVGDARRGDATVGGGDARQAKVGDVRRGNAVVGVGGG